MCKHMHHLYTTLPHGPAAINQPGSLVPGQEPAPSYLMQECGTLGCNRRPPGALTQHQSVSILRSVNLNIGSVVSPGKMGVRAA